MYILESSAQSTSSSEDEGDESSVEEEEQNSGGDVTNMAVVISQLVEKGKLNNVVCYIPNWN